MRRRQLIAWLGWYLSSWTLALLVLKWLYPDTGIQHYLSIASTMVFLSGAILVCLAALAFTGSSMDSGLLHKAMASRAASASAVLGGALAFSCLSQPIEPALALGAVGPHMELTLDADRDTNAVIMKHGHSDGWICDSERKCDRCHHLGESGAQERCTSCHRHLYAPTDLFSHARHARALQVVGCRICHSDPNVPKNRQTARECGDCHDNGANVAVAAALHVLQPKGSKIGMGRGMAPPYFVAVHTMCPKCHESVRPDLANCSFCHKANKNTATTLGGTEEASN